MDQQFRLKWNNHCNTLLQVFGNLLKTETLVDCTIGADGQYLKAHKVVVSACSPYFQSLFTEHFDKHPIIILKDIKFAELQSMIDYMYEGEVNISQDQLPSFLKAAASIQLKGLTQNVKAEAPPPDTPPAKPPLPQLNSARGGMGGQMLSNGSLTPSSMLNVELEEGQQRKKRKLQDHPSHPHPSQTHPPSSASSSPSLVPDLVVPNVILDVPGENNSGGGMNGGQQTPGTGGAGNNNDNSGLMKKEPSEYSGRSDDEEEDGMSHDGWDLSNDGLHDSNSTMSAGDRGLHHANTTPGGGNRPAGGPGGLSAAGGPDMSNVDENNQDLHDAAWEMFSGHSILGPDSPPTASQSVPGADGTFVYRHVHDGYPCPMCKKLYKTRKTLQVHVRFQCGKTPQYKCPLCPKTAYQKVHIEMHVWGTHKMIGWKYWNKNRPADATNRPHKMPLSAAAAEAGRVKTEESAETGDGALTVKCAVTR